MTARRELAGAVVAGAVAAGIALYAASRTWTVETTVRAAPLPDLVTPKSGGSLKPALPALALVGLAGVGALLATRARGRAGVGVIMAAAGLGVLVASMHGLVRTDGLVWPAVCITAGAVIALVGCLTVWRGRSWPAMGARYERTGPPRATPARAGTSANTLWDAIDRGNDPTKT